MSSLMYVLREIGERLRETAAILWRCFYSVTMTILGAVGLAFIPQGIETLRLVAQPGWNFPLFLFSVAAWSLAAWYSSRLTLGRVFLHGTSPLDRSDTPYLSAMRTWLPRFLGVLPNALLAYTFWRLGEPILAAACAAAGVTVFIFVLKRRSWFASRFRLLEPGSRESLRFEGLQQRTIITVAIAIALSFALLAALWWRPIEVSAVVTAPVLLCFAFASWILFGDLILTYFFKQARLPSMAAAPLLLFVLFSSNNDNHAVALVDDATPFLRRDIDRHADAWLRARVDGGELRRGQPFPLYLVAAEGGGIRAAYWAGIVLAKLQDDSRARFSRHLFALSGVSGGSLAVSSFASLVADGAGGALLRAPCAQTDPVHRYGYCIRSVLRRDFLSPTLGYLMYPDMVQRFLPFPVESWDRARAMETAWKSGWNDATGSTRFAQRFDHLWRGDARRDVPSLLLNATLVAEGNRVIASDLVIDGRFPDAYDAFDPLIDLRRMSLATAIHNSARFSYMSPAGTVYACRREGKLAPCAPGLARAPWGRLIDGGYFENSGVESLRDLLFALRPALQRWREDGYDIEPAVIVISSSPGALAPSGKQDPSHARMDPTFLSELLAPPLGLFNTRAARATFAVTAERRDMAVMVASDAPRFLWFGMHANHYTPLGWALAERSFNGMDDLLDGPEAEVLPFRAVIERLPPPAAAP